MSDHDINGPSQLSKREACPGSAAAEAALPEQTSAEAGRGNLGHAWMHATLRGREAPAILDDLAEPCAYCLSVANGIIDTLRALGMPVPEGKPVLVLVEYPVDLTALGIAKGGTLDYALVWPRQFGILLDWKFGDHWTPNPKFNRQMQAYAIGLSMAYDLPTVVAGICQPELSPDLRLRVHQFNEAELALRASDIKRIVAWTKVADPPRNPGEHCIFCKGKDACPARQEFAAQLSILRDPSALFFAADPVARRALWEKISHAMSVLGKAKDDIVAVAVRENLLIDGYHIGAGRGSREWALESEAKAALTALAVEKGLDPGVVEVTRIISPAEADKIIGKSKAVRERLEPLITKTEGKPTIVPDFHEPKK